MHKIKSEDVIKTVVDDISFRYKNKCTLNQGKYRTVLSDCALINQFINNEIERYSEDFNDLLDVIDKGEFSDEESITIEAEICKSDTWNKGIKASVNEDDMSLHIMLVLTELEIDFRNSQHELFKIAESTDELNFSSNDNGQLQIELVYKHLWDRVAE